ncbi:uncharacterized protein LOC142231197 [Haematobia irritans]|uniref:uncharacterized protein LOC142231197 n=1 Tax=Haematobia irritans TaxID=7368 RepID=UPI003F4F457F
MPRSYNPEMLCSLPGVGMKNIRNSCYMNATLQAFFHVPMFTKFLLNTPPHKDICNKNSKCLICVLKQTFVTTKTSLLDDLFLGHIVNKIKCISCGKECRETQPFMDISLSITDCSNLQDALDNYFKAEKLSDYSCSHCGSQKEIIKQSDLEKLPNIICLHLNRYESPTQPIEVPIHNNLTLDFAKYMSSKKMPKIIYRMVTLVARQGTTATNGHFVAYCSVGGEIYRFDDKSVTKTTTAEFSAATAVLILFERVIVESLANEYEILPTLLDHRGTNGGERSLHVFINLNLKVLPFIIDTGARVS